MKFHIESFETLLSTQDLAISKARNGAPEGTVIQAALQTAGRGRGSNRWIAAPGNLLISVILRPMRPPHETAQIAFVAAVAVGDAIQKWTGDHALTLKWPNDVLIGSKKISGILIETEIKEDVVDCLIVGVGLNVLVPPDDRISIKDVCKKPPSVNEVRDAVLEKLDQWYELWLKKGFAPVREAWLKQAHGLGKEAEVRLSRETLTGIFRGLDEDGALLLETETGIRPVHAAEVHFGLEK